MTSLITPASLTEWSLACVGVLGAIGGILKISNCKTIKCFCISCEREPPPIIDPPAITRAEIESQV